MSIEVILLTTGFLLSLALLVLIIIFASHSHHQEHEKVKEDIHKIKRQINSEK